MSFECRRQTAMEDYVTVTVAGQLFGIRLDRVRDVFVPQGLCPVPLAPPEVAGLLNLRGRVVTVIDLRQRLGLGSNDDVNPAIAVGVREQNELYGLLADRAGDVLRLEASKREATPSNLVAHWRQVCGGVYRLESELLLVLDVDKVLAFDRVLDAAQRDRAGA